MELKCAKKISSSCKTAFTCPKRTKTGLIKNSMISSNEDYLVINTLFLGSLSLQYPWFCVPYGAKMAVWVLWRSLHSGANAAQLARDGV